MPHAAVLQSSLRNNDRPLWELERSDRRAAPDVLRLGEERMALSDIASYDAGEDRTAYRHGRLVAALLFAGLAGYTVLGVTELGWQWRYILAAYILFALAGMAVQDVYLANSSRLFQFRIRLRNGRTIKFSTADPNSAAALVAVLDARR